MTKKRIIKFCKENKIEIRNLDSFFDSVYTWEIFIKGEWESRISFGGKDLDHEFGLILKELSKED